MAHSFSGKILRVDLTQGTIAVDEPTVTFYRRYMGGWNIIADILLRETKARVDALGPRNKLVFAPGVLTGTTVSGTARNAVGAASPLTGAFGAAEVGGQWGVELKRAGYDAVIVEGVSPKPVYLWIKDQVVELRDASHLWGKPTADTLASLGQDIGEKRFGCTLIGPGGENLVRFACLMNETFDAAGRTGLGAVMGSKKLKAIVTRGTEFVPVADPEKIKELAQWMSRGVKAGEQAAWLVKYGTGARIEEWVPTGNVPIRNFRDGEFPGAAAISANALMDQMGAGMDGCWACALRCKKALKAETPYVIEPHYGGPEYETIAALGSCCGVDDPYALSEANQLCNAYSLDTISTGVTIAWAMECFEQGLLTLQDTGGLELCFGNGPAMVETVKQIAYRQGIGALLAEGCWRAAQQIGQGSERFAMVVKGQELPMHEPRFKRAMAIGYAVSPTGADHNHSLHDSGLEHPDEAGFLPRANLQSLGVLEPMALESLGPEKVRAAMYASVLGAMCNCLLSCIFVPWSIEQQAALVRAATGWDVSAHELFKVGERALTLARVFNVREGLSASDDRLPERLYGPTTNGALAQGGIEREALQEAIRTFYGMMGWDEETGVPRAAKLHELDVAWAIPCLASQRRL